MFLCKECVVPFGERSIFILIITLPYNIYRNILAEMAEYFLPEPEKVLTTFREKLEASLIELSAVWSLNMDTGK